MIQNNRTYKPTTVILLFPYERTINCLTSIDTLMQIKEKLIQRERIVTNCEFKGRRKHIIISL